MTNEELEEKIADIIIAALEKIEKRGHIEPACGVHGRDELAVTDHGEEFCRDCAADDESGELGYLALDTEAIDMARQIMSLIRAPITPPQGQ